MTEKLKNAVYAAHHENIISQTQWKGLIGVIDDGGFKALEHCDNNLVIGACLVAAHMAGVHNAILALPKKELSPISGDPYYYNFVMFWRLSERLEQLFIAKLKLFGLVSDEHVRILAHRTLKSGDTSVITFCADGQFIEHRYKRTAL